jgi:hypothetical protein
VIRHTGEEGKKRSGVPTNSQRDYSTFSCQLVSKNPSYPIQPHGIRWAFRLSLDKYLILRVFSYLRISELAAASQVSSFFLSCYRALWNDKEFFFQLETDKLTSS